MWAKIKYTSLLITCALLFRSKGYATPVFAIPNDLGEGQLAPLNLTNAQQKFISQLVFDSLVTQDTNNRFISSIAKSWSIDPSLNTIDFVIDSAIRFSDGSALTIQDIVSSFEASCVAKKKGDLNSIFHGCESGSKLKFSVVNEDTIRLYSKVSPSLALGQLSGGNFPVFKKVKEKYLGSGPYFIESHSKYAMRLKKNRFTSNIQGLETLEIRTVPEEQIAEQIRQGELTGAIMYLASSFSYKIRGFHKINSNTPNTTLSFFPNNKEYPFSDSALRKSIHHSIKKVDFSICYSHAHRPNGLVPFGVGGSLPIENGRQDYQILVKARKNTKLSIYGHVGRKNQCVQDKLVRVFKNHGIDPEFFYLGDYKKLWPIYLSKTNQAFLELAAFKYRDAYSILKYFSSDGKTNFINLSSDRYDALLFEANSALSRSRRLIGYQKAGRYLDRNSHIFPLAYLFHTVVLRSSCISRVDDVNDFNPFLFLRDISLIEGKKCNG
tara:strand:- start:323 stop:1804 length:1482 start_codon:yes stop_codon:yes gene_type:complete